MSFPLSWRCWWEKRELLMQRQCHSNSEDCRCYVISCKENVYLAKTLEAVYLLFCLTETRASIQPSTGLINLHLFTFIIFSSVWKASGNVSNIRNLSSNFESKILMSDSLLRISSRKFNLLLETFPVSSLLWEISF